MSIVQRINDDIKQAMLAKDKAKLEALRAIKSAILLLATEKVGTDVSDEAAITAMQKLVKQRQDAAAIYRQQGRPDMYEVEEFQAEVISTYLPAMLSEAEIRQAVKSQIAEVNASGPQDMGKVMGPLTAALKGKADGKLISQIVKEELAK